MVRTSQRGSGDGTCHHLFGLLFRFGYDIRCLECFQSVRIYSASSFGTTIILGIVHVRGVCKIHTLHMNHLTSPRTNKHRYIQLVGYCLLLSETANSLWISGFVFDYPYSIQVLCKWWFFVWRLTWFVFVFMYVHVPMTRGTCIRWMSSTSKTPHSHRIWRVSDYVAFYFSLVLSMGTLGFAISFVNQQHAFIK